MTMPERRAVDECVWQSSRARCKANGRTKNMIVEKKKQTGDAVIFAAPSGRAEREEKFRPETAKLALDCRINHRLTPPGRHSLVHPYFFAGAPLRS